MKKGRIDAKAQYKNLLPEEVQKLKDEKKKAKKDEFDKIKNEKKEAFNKLSKIEQNKIKMEAKKSREENKLKNIEFPYINELSNDKIEQLKTQNKVYVDPGKKNLLMMYDDNGNKYVYRNKRRIKETKRLKYQKLKENYIKKNRINSLESDLKNYNSKTCSYKKFKEYIKCKNIINKTVSDKYSETFFRKYKWYAYINKNRHEDNILNEIERIFGIKSVFLFGDWGKGKQMRNFISTPMIGLKRKLSERFKIYNLDEFRTSLLNYKNEEICKNLYLPDKKGILRKLHSVLTYKMENNRYGLRSVFKEI